ncbi:MAG: metallophosphoesterase, partial [FCB group bacterium]|nr:metallophosphoesterase [FCB group bacterium]
MLGPAWEANLDAILEDGPIDLVCFTGDAADWGKRDEFDEADEFLAALLDRLDLPRERLFVVPGNHDVDRSIHPDPWEALRRAADEVDELDFARWIAGGDAPRGIESSWRERVLERQAAWRSWVGLGLGRPELVPATDSQGLGYRVVVERRRLPIHVVGLDTAWLCGDDVDAGRLRVTDEQVMRLLTGDGGEPLSGLRLVLMHHPLHDLADGDRVRALLAEHADLVLRGHLHATELSTWADPDRSLRQLAAGCLYEGDRADRW